MHTSTKKSLEIVSWSSTKVMKPAPRKWTHYTGKLRPRLIPWIWPLGKGCVNVNMWWNPVIFPQVINNKVLGGLGFLSLPFSKTWKGWFRVPESPCCEDMGPMRIIDPRLILWSYCFLHSLRPDCVGTQGFIPLVISWQLENAWEFSHFNEDSLTPYV